MGDSGDLSDKDSIEDVSVIEDTSIIVTNPQTVSEKSRKVYEKNYKDFLTWKASKSFTSFCEEAVLMYFEELSRKFKPTTLWTIHAQLKMMLLWNHEVDIGKYTNVSGLLKSKSVGHTITTSKTFTADEINKFLMEAPNKRYLATKVALILGVSGACRAQELYHLKFSDVEVFGSRILVKVNSCFTNTIRTFAVKGKHCKLCLKYMSLRPQNCRKHFFLNYQSGKCTVQNFGINKIGGLAKSIAKYLELPDHKLYNGHCFRTTAARIFVDNDGNFRDLRSSNGRFAVTQERSKYYKTEVATESNTADKIQTEKVESNKTEENESNKTDNDETTESYIDIKLEPIESMDNDKSETETEDSSTEDTTQVTNENLNTTERDIFEFLNEPSTSNLKNSNNYSKSDTVENNKVDSTDDSNKNGPQVRNQMFNTISNQTIESVNIHIPNIADLPSSFVPVNFNNCTIRNVNYYYNK